MMRSSTSFTRHVWYTLTVLFVWVGVFAAYVMLEGATDAANTQRMQSFLLADELRQSSDDLTRMARLYVVTGDIRQQRYYQDILDIRDGLKPRPERYDGIYWDLVVATGVLPRLGSTAPVSLLQRMQGAGFPQQEFDVLARAKKRSDELTRIEREAMRLRQASGASAAQSHALARDMLHNSEYLTAKAAIMQPIDDFYVLMSERTNRVVVQAERNAWVMRGVLIGLALVLLLMAYRTSRALKAVMGGSVDEVEAQIARIGRGDFSGSAAMPGVRRGTVLARLAETRGQLKRMDDERTQVQTELQRSEMRLNEAQRLARLGNWELNLVTNVLVWSDETYRIFEIDKHNFGASYEAFLDTIHPQDRFLVSKAYTDSVRNRLAYEITHRLVMADGRVKYVNQQCETLYDEDGKPLRSIGTVQDVTAGKLGELALERVNRDLRLLSDCNMALVRAQDESKLLAEICRLCVETGGYLMAWVGYAEQDAARSVRPLAHAGDVQDYLEGVQVSWGPSEQGQGPTGAAIRTGQPCVVHNVLTSPLMTLWREAALERGYRSCVALPLICDAQVLGALTMYARDESAFDAEELKLLSELAGDLAFGISTLRTRAEHVVAKEKLEFLANFDPLTHLPNRLLLRDRFEQAARVARSDNGAVALLYLDLDRFTQINDSLGYAVGDQVLVLGVERLRQCLPNTATISRLSGDEFVIVLTDNVDASSVAGLANAIRDVFVEPIQIDNHWLNVSCSVGISLFPIDGQDFDNLLKHAHAALDSAKEAGRNTYRFYAQEMNAGMAEQIRITGGLTHAVRNQEFLLHYQPQLDSRTGRIVGAEALVRWQHPTDGLVFPGRFIALAERSGHIVQIGAWVLNEACRQGRIWQDRLAQPPVVAVNFSALQFKHGNVLDMVTTALAVSGLRADRLELELTESVLLQDVEATIKTLHSLKALGVKLSIDDFGTGYSSLSYLKQLAVDKLKIDMSFVRDMLGSEDGASIVRAIIQLGHNLQLTVIAEGVESQAQFDFLNASGCDEVQGYLFSRPVSAEEMGTLLEMGSYNAAPSPVSRT